MRSFAGALLVFLAACGDDGSFSAATEGGSQGGSSGSETGPSSATQGGTSGTTGAASSTGAAPGCQDDADCGDHEVCDPQTQACECAEGFVSCGEGCVPELQADVELQPYEVIDDAPTVTRSFDLEIGGDGEPVVLYTHDLDDLWFARRRGSAWVPEYLYGPSYGRLDGGAVVVDPDGNATVMSVEFENGSSTWRRGTLADGAWAFGHDLSWENSTNGFVDAVLDDAQVLHVAYGFRFSSTSDLHYWVYPDSEQRALPLHSGIGVSPLVVDDAGHVHLAYDVPGDAVAHTAIEDGQWSEEDIEPLGINIGVVGLHLGLDPDGQPRVAYLREGPGEIVVARRSDAGWTTEVVHQAFDLRYVSFVVDGRGAEHISYQRDDLSIAYARHDGAQWTHFEIPEGPDFAPARLAVSADGTAAHIVWNWGDYEPDVSELRYARATIDFTCD